MSEPRQPTDEELAAAYEAQLKQIRVEDVLIQTLVSLLNLGGRKAGAASDQILRFDPARNIGLPAGRLPVPVYDGAAAAYRGGVYLIGGVGARGTSLDSVIALH